MAAQARKTLTNIQALIEEAGRRTHAPFSCAGMAVKVYVRYPSDLPAIQQELRSVVGRQAGRVCLQADICRQDLLVEIEATGQIPWSRSLRRYRPGQGFPGDGACRQVRRAGGVKPILSTSRRDCLEDAQDGPHTLHGAGS